MTNAAAPEKAKNTNPITAIAKVEVVFVNGNRVAFEDESGVKLSNLKTVASLLKEEVRAVA
jgi:hypothetical protein